MTLLLRSVEMAGRVVDVRVAEGLVAEIGSDLTGADEVIDGVGGALLPGLHDHHLHLYAAAAAAGSIAAGPPTVREGIALRAALHAADRSLPPGRWLRAVGYHESVAGDLDCDALDALVPHRPTRVQHRSGARWTLNTAAIDAVGLSTHSHPGIERDRSGRPTGRLHRADDWLRSLLPAESGPDLASLGGRLAAYGVTGVTDTTPFPRLDDLDLLAEAVASGALAQRVIVTGGSELAEMTAPAGLTLGPVKLVIDDHTYPALDELAAHITRSHAAGRNVAVHCVTRTALVLALAAWDLSGSRAGDRVEHGAVVPPELIDGLRRHGLTVVTQPGFVAERGDEYLAEVDRDDLRHLYPCATLLASGVPVAGGTDAPFTSLDPWAAMRAAVERRSPAGTVVGAGEVIAPLAALRLFLGRALQPGGPPRAVRLGQPADLCLLDRPLADALTRLRADDVVATVARGRLIRRS